ncbi:2-succinyl-5-enolpyruvyl-6-hydroxy-3-cyclohexene-1-carboxylic-acid synthase [Fluviispira sanaruensis]|uniref:2-succinyl-5-enolpyruvyl-6-hydroxy-3-cyclohexene-1-carboxylic-acid synthase n=1 Tax=Fluviispira sanaruensis TaxID=2493639 RepID=A0A4P2VK95_FLUSA|nr:2-succinyl-5-enolpyruvyl-6-hydroxy-3-cyclohexene-1-carboxylic-acid synthase [Fluviispira sanaruensis]BBH53008.1 2-succinyl-5-enolpyruvyl-6-hydroxy-3-cyclohexene-1-carboxylic-acid synthase [Fluviispira sanaruensis]
MKSNRSISSDIIKKLLNWGVSEFYVCAGARNIPLVETLINLSTANKKIIYNHFDERSAGFYAIGRIKSLNKPVCVITTSGTAVGELLAPAMEAYYSGLPLVLLTADRPKSFRGTGAPQSAEQNNIFGKYVSSCYDIEADQEFEFMSCAKNKPLHINVCFDIPLQSGALEAIFHTPGVDNCPTHYRIPEQFIQNLYKKIDNAENLIVIVSQIHNKYKDIIIDLLCHINLPVYLESISNLREESKLSSLKIKCADKIWINAKKSGYKIDTVIKIGNTPTHRIWRDLEEIYKNIEVISLSDNIFPGHSRAKHFCIETDKESILYNKKYSREQSEEVINFLNFDNLFFLKLQELFIKYPNSEQAIMYTLSKIIPNFSRLYLGNSLSIRHWDLAAQYNQKNFYVEASRGLNGIDGQISTFYGFSAIDTQNFAIIGDLTALYDLSAPWVLEYQKALYTHLIVINNSGGKIFGRVLSGMAGNFCQNIHNYRLEHWCKMWNMEYLALNEINNFKLLDTQHNVYEIFPDQFQTDSFNEEFNNIEL